MATSGNNAYINRFMTGAVNALAIARASNTTFTVGAGAARDSTDTCNIALSSSVTVDFGLVGVVNGIDTGAIAATKMYNVFLIGDSMGLKTTGCLVSLSTTPSLPAGYDMYRLVGYLPTNGSTQLSKGITTGSGNTRRFLYEAVVATAVTAGAATSYTAVDLSNTVPAVDNTPVLIYTAYTPATAGNTVKFTGSGLTGDSHTVSGQVAAKISDQQFIVNSKLITTAPKIDYKVANASDAVAISVEGFEYNL